MGCKEAGVEFSFRREARPGAVAAERLSHRRDETDFPGAVVEAPALGHLAEIILRDWMHRAALRDARRELARGDHHVRTPSIAIAHVHELDEGTDQRPPTKAHTQ